MRLPALCDMFLMAVSDYQLLMTLTPHCVTLTVLEIADPTMSFVSAVACDITATSEVFVTATL